MTLLFSLLSGCAGVLDLGRATPLAPGDVQFTAAGSVSGLPGSPSVLPAFGAGVHAGVAPRLELGGTVVAHSYGLAGDLDAKVALTPVERHGFHLALGPRVGVSSVVLGELSSSLVARAELPVLLGWDLGRSQVVLAPTVGVVGGERWALQLGASAGVAIPVGRVELQPTLGVSTFAEPGATWTTVYGGGLRLALALQ